MDGKVDGKISLEIKNGFRIGWADPGRARPRTRLHHLQLVHTLKSLYGKSSDKVMDIRPRGVSCTPTLVVGAAGRHLSIAGQVFS